MHVDVPSDIPLFKISPAEIAHRVGNGAGRALSMDFAELHA